MPGVVLEARAQRRPGEFGPDKFAGRVRWIAAELQASGTAFAISPHTVQH